MAQKGIRFFSYPSKRPKILTNYKGPNGDWVYTPKLIIKEIMKNTVLSKEDYQTCIEAVAKALEDDPKWEKNLASKKNYSQELLDVCLPLREKARELYEADVEEVVGTFNPIPDCFIPQSYFSKALKLVRANREGNINTEEYEQDMDQLKELGKQWYKERMEWLAKICPTDENGKVISLGDYWIQMMNSTSEREMQKNWTKIKGDVLNVKPPPPFEE